MAQTLLQEREGLGCKFGWLAWLNFDYGSLWLGGSPVGPWLKLCCRNVRCACGWLAWLNFDYGSLWLGGSPVGPWLKLCCRNVRCACEEGGRDFGLQNGERQGSNSCLGGPGPTAAPLDQAFDLCYNPRLKEYSVVRGQNTIQLIDLGEHISFLSRLITGSRLGSTDIGNLKWIARHEVEHADPVASCV
ncbi:hypothetical protein VNO77_18967 [Canavalia gladiata]|uniref:Uncharacterized protein n=1 Tax=Canavalia gladiata TaxID=3824 RepID=A0AAN9QI42_CANGL